MSNFSYKIGEEQCFFCCIGEIQSDGTILYSVRENLTKSECEELGGNCTVSESNCPVQPLGRCCYGPEGAD